MMLTDNDLPVLLLGGDLVSRAEFGEASAAHDVDNQTRHVLLVGNGHLVFAMPPSVSTAAVV